MFNIYEVNTLNNLLIRILQIWNFFSWKVGTAKCKKNFLILTNLSC
jgi:hypothetical protein